MAPHVWHNSADDFYPVRKIIEVAKELPNINFVLQGAHVSRHGVISYDANKTYEKPCDNIHFLPWVNPSEIMFWASSADIGIIPHEKIFYYK